MTDPITPITFATTGAMGPVGVAVRLVYDPADPFAVSVHLHDWTIEADVVWVFARDLLAAGLTPDEDGAEHGDGDLIITRVNEHTMKITRILHGDWIERSELVLVSARVRSFIEASRELVPAGGEWEWATRCPSTPEAAFPARQAGKGS
ncbi:SsgA family sporulation/cell division regulator [Saccharothrix sp. Mg75]|uniref:SsgA family sporulation/cell division regulator n=1 Tax=Saccharothrix sp. Mg75 TaxID=3445357 RepID=UPI003EEF66F4